jgi:hypothetical protein
MSDKLGAYRYGREVHEYIKEMIKSGGDSCCKTSPDWYSDSAYELVVKSLNDKKKFDEFYVEPRIDNIRPDVVAINNKKKLIVIYDFKTGELSDENIYRYANQLKKYIRTIKQIPHWKSYKVRALLVFKDRIIDLIDIERMIKRR